MIKTKIIGESGLSPKVKTADSALSTETQVLAVQNVDQKGKVAAGGGGGAGGGNMVYLSPEDFSAVWASATTLTLAGLSFVPTIEQFKSVIQVLVDGSRETYQATDYNFEYAAGVLTVNGAAFVNTDLGYEVMLFGPDKAYNASLDVQESVVNNFPVFNELFVIHEDTTNLAGPAAYPYPGAAGFNLVGYRHAALTYKIDDCTMQIFCRNHVDHDWENITHAAYDSLTGGLAPQIIGGAGLALQGVLFWDYFTAAMCYCEITTFDATNLVELSMRLIP